MTIEEHVSEIKELIDKAEPNQSLRVVLIAMLDLIDRVHAERNAATGYHGR